MKACEMYKIDKYYKIATMYKQESGVYLSSKPIYIISVEASLEELSSKIFESLTNSRMITESEESNFWLGNKLLKELKENSFKGLYQKSSACSIFLNEKGTIKIIPYKYLTTSQGLQPIEEKKVSMEYSKELEIEITRKVVDVLSTLC